MAFTQPINQHTRYDLYLFTFMHRRHLQKFDNCLDVCVVNHHQTTGWWKIKKPENVYTINIIISSPSSIFSIYDILMPLYILTYRKVTICIDSVWIFLFNSTARIELTSHEMQDNYPERALTASTQFLR